ncbi:hypothetical protein VE02_05364 [Pseudogymnoascus sp. 03VT05]|nr:hypothetical protein VE02_05364 [Pseudogymnoascus sp. 03VT05]
MPNTKACYKDSGVFLKSLRPNLLDADAPLLQRQTVLVEIFDPDVPNPATSRQIQRMVNLTPTCPTTLP